VLFRSDLLKAIPNVRYLALDASYVDRIKHACGLVDTPYAMCLADDDMFLSAGLGSAIGLLERSPDVSACMGQVMGLDYDEDRSSAYFFPYGLSLAGYRVSDDSVGERLRFAFDGYRTATSYALYRAPAFKDVWLGIDTTSCLEATEYEHAIATYIGGKVATVPNLYWLRSFEAQPVDSVVDGTRKTNFPSWWNDDRFAAERAAFVERLTERLESRTEFSRSEAASALQESIDLILQKRHVGLVNRSKRLMLTTDILEKLYSSPSARRWIGAMKTTRLGRKLRSTVLKSIRGPIKSNQVTTGHADGWQPFPEREQLVSFLNEFHLAKSKASGDR
jgi:hypothetical protein